MQRDGKLIFDIGMSEGDDTSFYLRKGFRVVGVEADPTLRQHLQDRFQHEIADGRLAVVNRAAGARAGEQIAFYSDLREQGHSSVVHQGDPSGVERHTVLTTDWSELVAAHAVPYYLKIDIEGGEPEFLSGMLGSSLYPHYISAEIQTFRPIELFRQMGYERFRIINQVKVNQFPIPNPPLEGNLLPAPESHRWSGLFGRELPGKQWFSFEEITEIHRMLHQLWTYETVTVGWLDCHAWMPDGA